MTGRWTTAPEIRAKVRRRWDDGTLLRAYAARDPLPEIDVPLRGPRVAEISADIGAVQDWVAALVTGERGGAHYALEYTAIGGRGIGRNELPSRAKITSYDQAWAVLGVTKEVARLDQILAAVAAEPAVLAWVISQPLKALAFPGKWEALLAARRWLEASRGTGRYLREISAPGVDTKFVERHRGVLATLLDAPTTAAGFTTALGLAGKPETVRLRFDHGFAGLPFQLSEATFRLAELSRVQVAVQQAILVENETTFVSLPVPAEGVVIWGKGFEVGRAGSLPWLRSAEVRYWGDLDTHGFAILNQLRAWLPQTQSFLMDRETLLAHRDRWVSEGSPTRARLVRLTTEESALYEDLVSDRLGEKVRLEQERIDWKWAMKHLPFD
jgi:hypothetical protein